MLMDRHPVLPVFGIYWAEFAPPWCLPVAEVKHDVTCETEWEVAFSAADSMFGTGISKIMKLKGLTSIQL